jgi:hypothetical protein
MVVSEVTAIRPLAALKVQAADIDVDAASVLRQCVADNLDRLIEMIGDIVARGAP